MKSALENIVILDLSRVLAGPYATMMLGDFGARVIKVEQPGRGDDTRRWGPPFTENGESAYFFAANRNKESITLNLKSEAGRDVLRDLVRRADVLVENYRSGMMDGLGVGYSSLHEINSGLIYCAITGYGQNGPYRDRPGYDVVIEAQGGLMSITGPADGEPSKVGVAIVDVTTGLHAVIAILAALRHRDHTGQGQYIDLALFDTQLSWLINVASSYLLSGNAPRRYGNGHPTIVPYQTVPTADGLLMLAVGNDGQFALLCRALERPEWIDDPQFATNPARVENRDVLVPALEAIFRTRTTAAWYEHLTAAGVPCGPVNDIPTALGDPQAAARQMVQSVEHPQTGTIPQLGPVAKMSGTPPSIHAPPPLLGEHTDAVLADFLGYSAGKIAELRDAGAL
jgi:crotonobetainyl-CoA:carnitine CoA-transferase CaiB-like acyl-CoA transferase